MEPDGNCLFRSVADQLYGDQSLHSDIRKYVKEYLQIEKPYFINFIAEMEENSKKNKKKNKKTKQKQEKHQKDKEQVEKQEEIEPKNELDLLFDNYVKEMSEKGTWGDNIEIQIISEIYHRSVEIYVAFQETPMRTFQDKFKVNEPIRLSYHGECHYNSIKSLNHEKLIQDKIGVVEEESMQSARNRQKNQSFQLNENEDSLYQNFYNPFRSQFQLYDNEELYNRLIYEQSIEKIQSNEDQQMNLIYQSDHLYHLNDPQSQNVDYEKIIVINSVVNAGFSKEQAEQVMQIVGPNEDLIVNYILESTM
ncbi:hypothetical protein ABPG72_000507 [Tetrahymena utriculariae]